MKADTVHSATVITVLNLKGGVGKTHTAWLLASVCQERSLRILACDTDTQANFASSFVSDPKGGKGVDLLFHPGAEIETHALIRRSEYSHIDLIPPGASLPRFDLANRTAFDPRNRLTRTTDPAGGTTDFRYDAAGNLVSSIDARRIVTRFYFDARGFRYQTVEGDNTDTPHVVASFADAAGNAIETIDAMTKTSFEAYDVLNRPAAAKDPKGNIVEIDRYNASGQQTALVDGNGNVTRTEYNDNGSVSSVRLYDKDNVLVRSSSYTYYAGGRLETEAAGNDAPTYNYYDAAGRVSLVIYPQGNYLTRTYTSNGQVETEIVFDTNGDQASQTAFTYDGMGRVLTQKVLSPTSTVVVSITNQYDLAGRLEKTTDGAGNVTSFTYYRSGLVKTEKLAGPTGTLIRVVSYGYDADGNQTKTTDAYHHSSGATFDGFNRVQTFADAAGHTSSVYYDRNDNVSREVDPKGNATTYDRDADGLVSAEKHYQPNGSGGLSLLSIVKYTYDAGGQAKTATTYAPNGVTMIDYKEYGYDAAGETTSITDSAGTTHREFNLAGRLTLVTDPNGSKTKYVYNADGRVSDVTAGWGTAAAATTHWDYNGAGFVIGIRDPVGNVTQYEVNAAGLPTLITDPLGNRTEIRYDGNGNPTYVKDRDGRTREMDYKGNLLKTETWKDAAGNVVKIQSFTYDDNGNMRSASDSAGTWTMTYDMDNNVHTETWTPGDGTLGFTLTYGYDADGNTTSVHDSFGGTVTSAYDGLGLLSRRGYSNGSTQLGIAFVYDGAGRLTGVTRYSDSADTQVVGSSTLGYDTADRLTSIQHTDGAEAVANYSYGYDFGGRLSSETDNGTTTGYGYDATNQVTLAGGTGYSYDANGNRTMTGYVTGADNRLLSDGTWRYSFDAAGTEPGYDKEGNLIFKENIASGDTWTYEYDNANHRTSAVHRNADGTLIEQVTITYDVFGNRIRQDVENAASGQTTVQRFASDGQNVWALLDASGSLVTRFICGDAGNQPLARIDSTGQVAWYLTDHLGSVRDIVTNAGTVIDHIDYDAYGNITNETHPENGDMLKYAGMQWDPVQGDYFDWARWYSPSAGRFWGEDPEGISAGDSNFNRYTGNGPTNGTDPSGKAENDNASEFVTSRVAQLKTGLQTGKVTLAVAIVEDNKGNRYVLIGSSDKRVKTGYARGLERPGEIVVPGLGHAEVNVVDYAKSKGFKVIDIGATNRVCLPCQLEIKPTGANISTALKRLPLRSAAPRVAAGGRTGASGVALNSLGFIPILTNAMAEEAEKKNGVKVFEKYKDFGWDVLYEEGTEKPIEVSRESLGWNVFLISREWHYYKTYLDPNTLRVPKVRKTVEIDQGEAAHYERQCDRLYGKWDWLGRFVPGEIRKQPKMVYVDPNVI